MKQLRHGRLDLVAVPGRRSVWRSLLDALRRFESPGAIATTVAPRRLRPGSIAEAAAPLDEEQIVRDILAARRGDERAFARLHRHFVPALTRLALRRSDCSDTADECVQEAMLRAWQSLDRFEGGADDFAGWLARIVINACIDRRRYERRRPPTTSMELIVDDDERERPLADRRQTPDREAERTMLRENVDAAIDQVPEPFRTVLELDRRGCTYAEMAALLGVPLGTVRSRLSRARLRARGLLADVGTLTFGDGAGTCWSVRLSRTNAAILTATIAAPGWCRHHRPPSRPSRR